MAEAIAALAFAGNIVQFLEFGAKFATKAAQIAKAGKNSLSEFQELRHVTQYFEPLLKQLNAGGSSNQASLKSPSQSRLLKLSKECSQVVQELLQTLDDVGVNDSGRRTGAIIASFRLTWNHAKIDKLHQRIDKLRGQLAVELLISIREHASQSLTTQEAILNQLKTNFRYSPPKSNKQGSRGPAEDLGDAPGSIMLQYIRSTLESGIANEQMRKTENDIHQLLFPEEEDGVSGDNPRQTRPRIEMSESRRQKIGARIISSLYYSQIVDRETSIAEPHKETFRWMFKDSSSDRKDTKFREWLESNDRLYWITGKAGSGKSTLMKYISNFDGASEGSLRCKEHLQRWSGGRDRLIIASFYFWASGSSIEASQRGLYQSLLFQILRRCPYLLPRVVPKVWEAWSSFGLEINIERENSLDQILMSAIQELVEQRHKKVCLFIDGLDEYHGDHQKLIATFRSILRLPHVKICVSSRPWLVFEDNFNTEPSLKVQEFTYPDIARFVNSRFNENDGFARLQLREPEYAKTLKTNITDKASGVFLWIKLVVASLLTGLTNDDRLSDLQRRLNLLPPDLEKLYDAILDGLDPFYFGHASQYFQLLNASSGGPDALVFSFSDEESSHFALRLPIQEFTKADVESRRDTVKRRLNSRCKGLLEVSPLGKVQYLHRTVKDYLDGSEVRPRIDGAVEKDFDCHLQLCSAWLAMVKITDHGSDRKRVTYAKECLMMAAKVRWNVSGMIQILDDLDQTMKETLHPDSLRYFYQEGPQMVPQEFPQEALQKFNVKTWVNITGESFLGTTVRFSVVDYVRARAKAGCLMQDNNTKQLDMTTGLQDPKPEKSSLFKRLMCKSRISKSSRPGKSSIQHTKNWPLLMDAIVCDPVSLPMFRCLLEHGADPNLIVDRLETSPWIETLAAMTMCINEFHVYRESALAQAWEQWVPILELFLEHGAQMDDSICAQAVQRANRRAPRYFQRDWVATVRKFVDKVRGDLGPEYLTVEDDVARSRNFRGKPEPLRRNQNS